MDDITFEAALNGRVEAMLDACIRCGKCVEACPSVEPAGIADPRRHGVGIAGDPLVREGGRHQLALSLVEVVLAGEQASGVDDGPVLE